MLVTNKNLQDVLQSYAQRTTRSGAEAGARAQTISKGTSGRRDAVQLSSTTMDVRRAMQSLQSTPDVRQELVNSLRKDIQSGNFRIDTEEIATQLALIL
jgi:flagellar biosynthesis anti-sigma factor FlgM